MGDMVILLVSAIVLGVVIGVLSGLLGVGGGTVMVPMYRLAFGLSALASTGTSLFTIIPTSISGVVSHVRNKTCLPKLGIAMGLGGACTSPLGVFLADRSPSWLVMVAAAIVIAYSAFTMLQKARKLPKGSSSSGSVPPKAASTAAGAADSRQGAATVDETQELSRKELAVGFCIGLVAGVASGYVGLGGGFIMVPLMVAWLGLPMKKTSGTSLIAIMILAIPGTIEQGILGNIDYLVGLATAIGTVPGAYIGSKYVSRVPERTLRFLFAAFLAIGAVLLVAKELGVFG